MKPSTVILDLFQYRNNLNAAKDNNPLVSFLLSFPTIEKQKLAKIASLWAKDITLEECIESLPIDILFDEDMVQNMVVSEIAEKNDTEIYSILFQFCTIGWYKSYYLISGDEYLKSKILLILKKCKNPNFDIQKAYFFDVICRKYYKSVGNNPDRIFVELTIDLISENIFPDSSFFGTVALICKSINSSKLVEQSNALLRAIYDLLVKREPLLMLSDYSTLILLLQQKIAMLDPTSISIICQITHTYSSKLLIDSFVIISSSFFSYAVSNTKIGNLEQKQKEAFKKAKMEANKIEPDLFSNSIKYQLDSQINCKQTYDDENPAICKASDIGKSLKTASINAQKIFIESILNLIDTVSMPEYIIFLFDSFLSMINTIESTQLLTYMIPKIMNGPVMRPEENVFEGSLIPEISALRKRFFRLIKKFDPSAISYIINPQHPLLTIESIIRATYLGFSYEMFMNDTTYPLCSSIVFLSSIGESRGTIKAKASAFVFLVNMILDEKTSLYSLSSDSIISVFNNFFFERNALVTAFRVMRNALGRITERINIDATSSAFLEVCALISHQKDNKLADLVLENLAICLDEGVSPAIASQFEKCVIPIITYLVQKPNRSVFNHILSFIKTITYYKTNYLNNQELIKMLIEIIHNLDGDTPSPDILSSLYSILGGGVLQDIFLIRTPSILSTIIGAYGSAKDFYKILDKFLYLTQSEFNSRALHDGDVDIILLKYINAGRKPIVHNSINIDIRIENEHFKTIVLPLLSNIIKAKSSNAVAAVVAEHFRNNGEISEFLLNEIRHQSTGTLQRFPIGTDHIPLTASPIPCEVFNGGFSIEFKHLFDEYALQATTKDTRLFSLDAKNVNVGLYLYSGSISIIFIDKQQGKKVRVVIVKKLAGGSWKTMKLGFAMNMHPVRIYTFYDNVWRNNSELVSFNFSGNVELNVGGGIDNINIAYLSGITIAKGVVRPSSPDISDVIYSTNIVDSKNNIVSPQGNITTHAIKAISAPKILLDSLERGNNAVEIAEYFRKPSGINNTMFIIEAIKMLLEQPSFVQKTFTSTPMIANSLLAHPDILNYRVYIAFFRVFDAIKTGHLRTEWFTKIIFNTMIWIQCKAFDFKRIINHWSTILLSNAEDIIVSKSFFKIFINQYKRIFQKDKIEGVISYECKFTDAEMNEIDDLFLLFLKRLARVHLSVDDISVLFIHLSTCGNESIVKFLTLILDVSSSIRKVKEYNTSMIDSLCVFLQSDNIDIVILTLKIIHNLAGTELTKFLQCSVLLINKNVDKIALYNKLLGELEEYHNLLPLVVMFSINLGQDAGTISEILERWVNEKKSVSSPPFWFPWYIIFALENPKYEEDVANFIVYSLVNSLQMNEDVYNIILFCLFLQHETNYESEALVEKILVTLEKLSPTITNEVFRESIGKVAFLASMFKFSPPQYSDNFLLELSKSPFRSSRIFMAKHSVFQEKITEIQHLEHLTYFDISSIPIGAFIDLNEKMIWKQKTLGSVAQTFLKNQEFNQYIDLIINRSKLSEKDINNLNMNSLDFFDRETTSYKTLFLSHFGHFISSYRILFDEVNEMIANIPSFETNKNRSIVELNKSSKPEKKENEIQQTKRDRTMCANFCAYKMKTKSVAKVVVQRKGNTPSVYEQNCKVIGIRRTRDARIAIYKNYISISGKGFEKDFAMFMIKLLLQRSVSGSENCVEFFLSDGRSYLVDLLEKESIEFIHLVKKYIPSSITRVQSVTAPEFFAATQLTHLWKQGLITNFKYLMKLNILSGRSFNDKRMYPIFPSVLTQKYNQEMLNVSSITYNEPSTERVLCTEPTTKTLLQEVTKGCIIPEFYFLPAVVKDTDELPKWANSNFEFVYGHRKMLESEEVTQNLPAFINTIWGTKMKNCCHKRLFSKRHDKYSPIVVKPAINRSVKFSRPSNIIHIIETKPSSPYETNLLIFFGDGKVFNCVVNVQNELSIAKFQESFSIDIDETTCINSSPKGIICFSSLKSKASIISNNKIVAEHTLYAEDSLVAYCNKSILFCPDRCSVAYSYDRLSTLKSIVLMNTKSKITHLAVSAQFKILCTACEDGTVEVHSLKDGRLVNRVEVGEQPMQLIITKALGFVICFTKKNLVVMSVDGIEIKRCSIPSQFLSVFTFTDDSGFDYICGEDASGKFVYFEAMYPENTKRVSLSTGIMFATYNPLRKCFITVDNDSNVMVLPYKL